MKGRMPGSVLIIEDDRELGAQLVKHLERAGLQSRWLADGRPLGSADLANVDLVLLDLMLPSAHGLDVLKGLRELSDVPVLILSARNDTAEKVRGLKLGADDYMTKPFWPEELVERVRARLRRPVLARDGTVQIGDVRIAKDRREVTVAGEPIALTKVELDILVALAERAGAAVARRALIEKALDPERDGDERTLDVHISRLRKKLGGGAIIQTVWGIGYRLLPEKPE
jgi:two-component system response regulator MtrA